MCQGRCAGCGQTGPHRVIAAHTIRCPSFAALFRSSPEKALDPQDEWARWQDSGEAGAEKDAARQAQVGRTDDAREAMADRFRTRDPLEG